MTYKNDNDDDNDNDKNRQFVTQFFVCYFGFVDQHTFDTTGGLYRLAR